MRAASIGRVHRATVRSAIGLAATPSHGLVVRVNPLLVALSLALAALAIPNASAAFEVPEVPEKPMQCTYSGGDTDCRGEYGPCWYHTHTYDVEDALNVYEVSCHDCGVHFGAGGVQCEPLDRLVAEPSASAAPDPPFETHCWTMEDGSGCTTTFDLGAVICNYTAGNWGGIQHAWLECSNTAVGSCHVGLLPVQDPVVFWCENYGPPGESSAAQPDLPCVSGSAVSCSVDAGACSASAGASLIVTTAAGAAAACGLGVVYCEAGAGVGQVLLPGFPPRPEELAYCASASAASADLAEPGFPCQTGIAQTWCDFTVGPCFIRVVPWTAWGDQYLTIDCQGGGAGPTCHTEVHTEGPLNHEHWCAFASSAASTAAPPPCQSGFGSSWCTVTVGPCRTVVTTYTAWGDRWATLDCAAAGTRCEAEAHTDGLANSHSCGPEASAATAPPCQAHLPPYAGFTCDANGRHCEFHIWLDLNPPNPSHDCPPL